MSTNRQAWALKLSSPTAIENSAGYSRRSTAERVTLNVRFPPIADISVSTVTSFERGPPMTTSMRVWSVLRIIYGALFVTVGLWVFGAVLGIASPPSQPTMAAAAFMQALSEAHFIDPLLALSYLAGGGLLLFNRTAPAGLVILGPSVVVIFFFHLVLSGQYIWGASATAYFLLLCWHYRRGFEPLWSYPQKG